MPTGKSSTTAKLGLIVNPFAGIGGALAQKGSDDLDESTKRSSIVALTRSEQRASRALQILKVSGAVSSIDFYSCSGAMGQRVLQALGIPCKVIYKSPLLSSGADTQNAVRKLLGCKIDLLLFVGGDGTARDVVDAFSGAEKTPPVLGIPAGVKMHSSVYAVSPEAAGELISQLCEGKFVSVREAEVRDIDEQLFRRDIVKAKHYGDLWVPDEGRFLQHVKVGGIEDPELAKQDIAAEVAERLEDNVLYIIGPGSTMKAVMEELGLENTLLGVDVVLNHVLLLKDADENQLLEKIREHSGSCSIFITAIGGQGHVLGRGNQQISPQVIRLVGPENIFICATKAKIASLQGRPMLLDSNDPDLDDKLEGYHKIITGYHDYTLYPLAAGRNTGD